MSAPGSAAPHEEGLQRKLKARHLTMIAIGGAIGVGLFLGSAVTIRQAGPGVILSYLLSAPIALVVAYALAEMAVVHPLAGSFGIYAERYLNPWAGFSVRLTYSVVQVIAIGAEVTAVAIYFGHWFPDVPPWLWVAATSLGLVAINAAQVGSFGEFEYWFALVKVVAILAFIGVGGLILLGLVGPGPAPGLSNLTAHGGFLPNGWRGVWLAVALALTSYIGVEVVAVTAGEAERPEESIPKAMRTIVFRLIAFYVLATITALAALSVVTVRNTVHAALLLDASTSITVDGACRRRDQIPVLDREADHRAEPAPLPAHQKVVASSTGQLVVAAAPFQSVARAVAIDNGVVKRGAENRVRPAASRVVDGDGMVCENNQVVPRSVQNGCQAASGVDLVVARSGVDHGGNADRGVDLDKVIAPSCHDDNARNQRAVENLFRAIDLHTQAAAHLDENIVVRAARVALHAQHSGGRIKVGVERVDRRRQRDGVVVGVLQNEGVEV